MTKFYKAFHVSSTYVLRVFTPKKKHTHCINYIVLWTAAALTTSVERVAQQMKHIARVSIVSLSSLFRLSLSKRVASFVVGRLEVNKPAVYV